MSKVERCAMDFSVIIPSHNPRSEVLRQTLAALRLQSLPQVQWELLIIDNASTPQISADLSWHSQARIIREPKLGLTSARECGFRNAVARNIVLVDDDNLLAPDYLQKALELLVTYPKLGALGGKCLPRFEQAPPDWWEPHLENLLACRDLGDASKISDGLFNQQLQRNDYPLFAPQGAGMVIRRKAIQRWLETDINEGALTDRQGQQLTSGGDNDIVLSIMRSQWEVGYFPGLSLIHLIPTARLQLDYLKRLNRGISKSWIQVLHKHHACPWLPISAWTLPLRKAKAWIAQKPWRGPVEQIRWQGVCGHFEGLASISSAP